jgi:hypothetical protein
MKQKETVTDNIMKALKTISDNKYSQSTAQLEVTEIS